MMRLFVSVMMLLPVVAAAHELDLLPLGSAELANELGSAEAGMYYDCAAGAVVDMDVMVERMAEAHVVLLGEEHTAMDQKLLQAGLLDALADTGRRLVLAMEFFQRDDTDTLDRWSRGEIDDRGLLEATGWYDRGGYRWEYYRAVMEVARERGIPIVGANVPRDIPRSVNRGGLDSLTDEQRTEVGEVVIDGSPQHRYLISRYFGDTVAMLPPGWFDNMYAAQCLWDVVMARSMLEEVAEDTTVVLIVGSGHVAYDLGIPRRLEEERRSAGQPLLDVVTLCPTTAPAPAENGEPTGHPMGGGDHGMGSPGGAPAQFARTLADYVAVFPDRAGIDAFPTLGLRLKGDEDDRPVVSMVWPDTLAETVGFKSEDRILDVNGVAPSGLGELRFLLAEIRWGERLGLKVDREGETLEIAALLFPPVDMSETSAAPGYAVDGLDAFDPGSTTVATEQVVPEDRARWTLVTEDGVPVRAEVWRQDVLDEVHELDEDARVERSLYRMARASGSVEIRYLRSASGEVIGTRAYDRTGTIID